MLGLSLGSRAGSPCLLNLLTLSPALLRTLRTYQTVLESDAQQDKRYVDRLKITARAGRGGNGCISHYQGASRGKKFTPDGGSGGDGGNVVVRAVSHMKSLAGVQQLYKAEGGLHGTKQRQQGRTGRDIVVLVPVGTVVHRLLQPGEAAAAEAAEAAAAAAAGQGGRKRKHDRQRGADDVAGEAEELPEWIRRWKQPFFGAALDSSTASDTEYDCIPASSANSSSGTASGTYSGSREEGAEEDGEDEPQYRLLGDLVEEGQEVVVARGGAGGRGNAGLKARGHQEVAAGETQGGDLGESARLLLELKLLADVGLVGLPNAGKSTLLRALTRATPRVGAYAFTTLTPQLGVVAPPTPDEEPIVVADIPGLIEGAHQNRGLGHNFLRHIERTKAIAFVLDCQLGYGGREGPKPWDQLELLQKELAAYSPHLAQLPAIVLANKAETLDRPADSLAALRKRTALPVLAVSAKLESMMQDAPLDRTPQPSPRSKLQQSGSRKQPAVQQRVWKSGLHPLHYRLAQLLFEAGARQQRPYAQDFEPESRGLL